MLPEWRSELDLIQRRCQSDETETTDGGFLLKARQKVLTYLVSRYADVQIESKPAVPNKSPLILPETIMQRLGVPTTSPARIKTLLENIRRNVRCN